MSYLRQSASDLLTARSHECETARFMWPIRPDIDIKPCQSRAFLESVTMGFLCASHLPLLVASFPQAHTVFLFSSVSFARGCIAV
jgi:hypothetical protein